MNKKRYPSDIKERIISRYELKIKECEIQKDLLHKYLASLDEVEESLLNKVHEQDNIVNELKMELSYIREGMA